MHGKPDLLVPHHMVHLYSLPEITGTQITLADNREFTGLIRRFDIRI